MSLLHLIEIIFCFCITRVNRLIVVSVVVLDATMRHWNYLKIKIHMEIFMDKSMSLTITLWITRSEKTDFNDDYSPVTGFLLLIFLSKMGGEVHTINRLVVCISLVVALLSFTTYYINWVHNKEPSRANLASSPFFIAHTLDPTIEGYQFTSWTRVDWISWLDRRQIQYENANRFRKPLNQKGLNTVLIATPAEVMNGFEGFRHPFNPETHRMQPMFWSESIFDSFIFERNGQRVRVFKCPSMYIAVKFEHGVPVHLHAHSKRREMQGFKVKPTKDCKEIL